MKIELPIPKEDYERIFATIYSSLSGRAITERACIFFTLAGVTILREHYSIDCYPIAGAALFNIESSENTVVAFGRFENGLLTSDIERFHCWIETQDHAIDFMAPIFRESLARVDYCKPIPRLMFQKKLSSMVESLDDIDKSHAFALQQDNELSQILFNQFVEDEQSLSLLTACNKWFRRPPLDIPIQYRAFDTESNFSHDFLFEAPKIEGTW